MNVFTLNIPIYWRGSTRLPRDVAHLLLGVGILALVCETGMAQELIPMPSDNQSPAIEKLPQACQPIPVDPAGMELTVDIQPRGKDSQIVPEEQLPEDCSQYIFPPIPMLYDGFGMPSGGPAPGYNWAAARFCHHPLYFEETALERCGAGHGCCQPVISGAHFFGNIALLPWKMLRNCPRGCECTPVCDCAN